MMGNLLYIFDGSGNPRKIVRYCARRNLRKIFLCPITTDQEAISSVRGDLSRSAKCDVEILPYLERFNKEAFSERDEFIRFVSDLGKKKVFGNASLREYFKDPDSSFSAWWTSSIVEKNPLKSDSYHNLIKLLTILRFIGEREIENVLIDIDQTELSRAVSDNSKKIGYECMDLRNHRRVSGITLLSINFLKAMRYYFYMVYKAFIVVLSADGHDFRKDSLKNAKYIAITYFPLIDKDSFEKQKFVNRYYNSFQKVLEDRYKDKFVWLAIIPDAGSLSFANAVKIGRDVKSWNYPFHFIEEWITLKDLLSIPAKYFYFFARFIKNITHLSESLTYPEDDINVWPLFEEDCFSSFGGGRLMSGISFYNIFRNIRDSAGKDSTIIYLAENQVWERALNAAFYGRDKVSLIGLLHTTIPLLQLQFFDYRDDIRASDREESDMPVPDRLACNGKIPLDILKRSGWGSERLFLWYAIRYQHLERYLKTDIPWEERQNKIVVILSVKPNEVKEMLFYIKQAFEGESGYKIILKEHYLFPIRPFMKKMNIHLNEDIFIISDENLSGLLRTSKAMIVTGSSAALESIALGCPVIIPRLSSVVDMNPFSGISDLAIHVDSPPDLRDTVDDIIKRYDSPMDNEKRRNLINDYFEFFNSEDELIAKVEHDRKEALI